MKETELKPCPFCGGETAELITCKEVNCHNEDCESCCAMTIAVCCNMIKGGCGAVGGYYAEREEAIKAWNRRADDENK